MSTPQGAQAAVAATDNLADMAQDTAQTVQKIRQAVAVPPASASSLPPTGAPDPAFWSDFDQRVKELYAQIRGYRQEWRAAQAARNTRIREITANLADSEKRVLWQHHWDEVGQSLDQLDDAWKAPSARWQKRWVLTRRHPGRQGVPAVCEAAPRGARAAAQRHLAALGRGHAQEAGHAAIWDEWYQWAENHQQAFEAREDEHIQALIDQMRAMVGKRRPPAAGTAAVPVPRPPAPKGPAAPKAEKPPITVESLADKLQRGDTAWSNEELQFEANNHDALQAELARRVSGGGVQPPAAGLVEPDLVPPGPGGVWTEAKNAVGANCTSRLSNPVGTSTSAGVHHAGRATRLAADRAGYCGHKCQAERGRSSGHRKQGGDFGGRWSPAAL